MKKRIFILLILSAIWMLGSWWYYTCKIKGFCDHKDISSKPVQAANPLTPTPVIPSSQTSDKKSIEDTETIRPPDKKIPALPSTTEETKKEKQSVVNNKEEESLTPTTTTTITEKTKPADNNKFPRIEEDSLSNSAKNNINPNISSDIIKDELTKAPLTPSSEPTQTQSPPPIETNELTIEPVGTGLNTSIQTSRLYFPFNSSQLELSDTASAYFGSIAEWLKTSKNHLVILTGHTDDVGENKRNYQLGLRRAALIKDILVRLDSPKDQIKTQSKGEIKPLRSNQTKAGRQKNRRVELTPVNKEK